MIPSTFISTSLLESAGDFQLPGCNNFCLYNLTFHFEPLICTWGLSCFLQSTHFPRENSPGAVAHPPLLKSLLLSCIIGLKPSLNPGDFTDSEEFSIKPMVPSYSETGKESKDGSFEATQVPRCAQ